MMRVTRRPSDPEFDRFEGWQRRASVARGKLISAWEEAGRPTVWKPEIDRDLYREFREVFLYEGFHLKCAYCESKIGHSYAVQVEHYRPKGHLTDDGDAGHPGYFWLAYEWWNLVPTCNNCNTWHTDPMSGERNPGKSTTFLIQGTRVFEPSADPNRWEEELAAEDPLLLNPYLHEPSEHMEFDPKTGVPIPMSPNGRATIMICDLKRQSLCERRRDQGKLAVTRMLLQLIEHREPLDSLVPVASEYSLWLKCLLQHKLAIACVDAGMAAPQRINPARLDPPAIDP